MLKELAEGAAVDFYYAGSLVCWTDHGLEMIQCVTYNNTETTNRVSDLIIFSVLSKLVGFCQFFEPSVYSIEIMVYSY